MESTRGSRAGLWLILLALASFFLLRQARSLRGLHDRPPQTETVSAVPALVPEPRATPSPATAGAREPAEAPEPAPWSADPGALRGTVSDRVGRPVPGARCELRPGVPVGGFFEREASTTLPPRASAATDADGRFHLAAGAGHWSLRVESPGFARWERDHLLAGDVLEVRLDPEVWLVLTVLDAAGEPVALAEVTARPPRARSPQDWRARARTDARGQARTNALAPGSWRLVVQHPEHAAAVVPVEIPSGVALVEREIRLERGVRLVGSVRARSGGPLAGASVRVESPYAETFLLAEATSDEAGRYETAPLFARSETLEIVARAAGHAESTALTGVRPQDVAAGEVRQDFVLDATGRTVRGRIVLDTGAGVGGASVRVAAIDLTGMSPEDALAPQKVAPSAPWLWQEGARTSDSGAFELAGLSCVNEYALLILHEGYAPRTLWSPPGEPGSVHDLGEIPLLAHGSLFGRVLWEDGTPAEGEWVSVFRMHRVHLGQATSRASWRPDAWFHPLEARAGEGGHFRFDALAPGTYQILPSVTASAEVLPGAATGPLEVVLPRPERRAEIELAGRVRDPAGEPIAMAFVRAFGVGAAGEELLASSLAMQGRFALRLSSHARVRVAFTDLRGVHEGLELLVEPARQSEPLEVVLAPRAVPLPPIDGLVFDPRGAPLEGSTVTLHPPEDSLCGCITFQRRTDAAGAFAFSVAEGPHRLIASDPRYASATHAPAWPGDHVQLDLGRR